MLKTLGNDAQRECLNSRDGFIAVLAVGQDAGQPGDFSEPPAIVFAFDLNGERHTRNVPSGQRSNKLPPASGARERAGSTRLWPPLAAERPCVTSNAAPRVSANGSRPNAADTSISQTTKRASLLYTSRLLKGNHTTAFNRPP